MLQLRTSASRGKSNFAWLDGYHSFSFGEYYDPNFMGFKSLRVINQDMIAPSKGFGMHPHKDMEILTYVISGALEHQDSMGNQRTIQAGELQYMCAGSGVRHSEFNASTTEPVHLLQIWLLPAKKNLSPAYAEWLPAESQKNTPLILLASSDGREHSLRINQDALVFRGLLSAAAKQVYDITPKRALWLQLITGVVHVNGVTVTSGDGLAVLEEDKIELEAQTDSHYLLFDLAEINF